MSGSVAIVPIPGANIVPDGWWRSVVVPWADEQTTTGGMQAAAAQLGGLIEAYRTLGADTLELTRARRYVELRWGELLGDVVAGERTDLEPSHAGEGELSKDDRHRFRQLAAARTEVLALLERASDPDEITRAACVRLRKPPSNTAPARPAVDVFGALADTAITDGAPTFEPPEDSPAPPPGPRWNAQHERRARKIDALLCGARGDLEQASTPGMASHAVAELLRSAEVRARQATAQLGELAFGFE